MIFCEECPAHERGYSTNVIESDGPDDAEILIVGEAPGGTEDFRGIPFIGKAGQFLRSHVEQMGWTSVRYTNVVRCRPPENRTPTAKIVNSCAKYLLAEIERVDPKLVLLMGNTPLSAVLQQKGITSWRGTPFHRDGRVYLPTFHPSYVQRQLHDGTKSTHDEWIADLIAADSFLLEEGETGPTPDLSYQVVTTEKHLHRLMQDVSRSFFISLDSEVSTLDPKSKDARILCLSIGTKDSAWVIPLEHAESKWKGKRRKKALDCIRQICRDSRIIGHNLKFDMLHLYTRFGILVEKPFADTMLLSSLINPKKGLHGLKRLAAIHLHMADYDAKLEEYKSKHPNANPSRTYVRIFEDGEEEKLSGDYGNIPGDVLFEYAALDAIATYHLYDKLYNAEEMDDERRLLHDGLLMEATTALMFMEHAGILLDEHIVQRYDVLYQLAVSQTYHDMIAASPSLRRYIAGMQKEKGKGYLFNPRSYIQVGGWLYDEKGLECQKITESGNRSVDAEAIASHVHHRDVALLQRYRLYSGIYSKYVGPPSRGEWTGMDGRVRSTFNINGAVTGRLSSTRPNMQNIPTPEKEPGTLLAFQPIKNLFRATHLEDGGCLLQSDYSGMELRCFASLADCEPMIEAFEQGVDIHALVTSALYRIDIDDVSKELRYRGKWVNWVNLFGGDEHTLHRLYHIPLKEGQKLLDTYAGMFPEVREFHDHIISVVEKKGYYTTPFGRRYTAVWLFDENPKKRAAERRTLLNFPVQSIASDVLLVALTIIYRIMQAKGFRSRLVNTVHDSMVTDVYPGELEEVAALQKEVMEHIVEYAEDYLPGLSFDWLLVPLVVDQEIGSHYGSLEHYELGA